MNDCITCGRKIRMRSFKTRFNGKQGCSHWLEPQDTSGDCPCLKDYCWTKWRADKKKPSITEEMISKWNNENPPLTNC